MVRPRIPVDVENKSPVPEDVGETTNIIVATGKVEGEKAHAEDPVREAHEESQKVEEVAAMKKVAGNTTQQMKVLLHPREIDGAMTTIDGCMPSTIPIVREK